MRIDKRILENLADRMEKRDDIPQGWIYLGDEKERYILGQPGKRNMLVFGANPSTATPGESNIDPTVRKVRKLTAEAGYDGWVMVNIYPLRATDPRGLPKQADKALLEKNIKVLKALIHAYRIDAVWAAWGDIIDTRFYLGEVLYDIQEELTGEFEWYYRSTKTRSGNPRHPLYMKSGERFEWFPVADYVACWKYADVTQYLTMDMLVLDDVPMEDLNYETIHGYRNRYRILISRHTFECLDDAEYLRSIGTAAISQVDREKT